VVRRFLQGGWGERVPNLPYVLKIIKLGKECLRIDYVVFSLVAFD
jgi:hypothetical protein